MSTKEENNSSVAVADTAVPVAGAYEVPGGRWKNGLCSCFSACFCPCVAGWCCFPILLGQMVERLKYNLCGCPGEKGKSSPPACMIFGFFFLVAIIIEIVVQVLYQSFLRANCDSDGTNCTFDYAEAPIGYQICMMLLGIWIWFVFIVSCCTRMNMRKQHNIDPICCVGDNCCDDCLTTWCCNCCSAIQMIRQTHDEDEYPYKMTSRTGLDSDAPVIV